MKCGFISKGAKKTQVSALENVVWVKMIPKDVGGTTASQQSMKKCEL